jgi:hypothetical protein
MMVGITLSPEQIKSAPPEVRRWLEHEIATTLGLAPQVAGDAAAPSDEVRLADLTEEQAARVFALIQADYLACQVLFELAREMPNSRSGNGLRAFSIAEIARHTRVGDVERLAGCFGTINAAFQRVCGNRDATLFGFDQLGCCYISETSHRLIRQLWQRLVTGTAGSAPPENVAPVTPGPAQTWPQPATSPQGAPVAG